MASLARGVRRLQGRPTMERRQDFEKFRTHEESDACRALPVLNVPAQIRRPGGNGRKSGERGRTKVLPLTAKGPPRRSRVRRIRAIERRPAACTPARAHAHRLGMKVGSIHDVAVGCNRWLRCLETRRPRSRASSALAPAHPLIPPDRIGAGRLQRRRYRNRRSAYREMRRARCAMQAQSGYDHVLGLKRLYLVRADVAREWPPMFRCRSRRVGR